MKLLAPVILAFCLSPFGQQAPTIEGQSSGECSPNILSNQGKVQFTCNTSMNTATANKIVSLLNQILQKESSTTNPTTNSTEEINHKLDEILDFVRNQARHLSEDQKTKLASLLKAAGPQEFYFVSAPDAETTHFGNEILTVLDSAGWKVVPHLAGWGEIAHQGEGVYIWVSDVNKAPQGAIVLQQALKEIGVDAVGSNYPLMWKDKFGIYLGVKPASPSR
ncbi:MAG: hypothetical protein ABSG07_20425 [Terriglobales bacterium]|jgi:hypothetical protein